MRKIEKCRRCVKYEDICYFIWSNCHLVEFRRLHPSYERRDVLANQPCTCDMHYKPYRKSDQEIRDEGEKNE